jgi:hypothetical protein
MASRFGRRIRKGAAGTALAAAAMAALTASQAPGLSAAHRVPSGPEIDGGSPFIDQMPPHGTIPQPDTRETPGSTGDTSGSGAGSVVGTAGIPAIMLQAYEHAQTVLAGSDPGCHLPWQLLAAIGQVESDQAEAGSNINGTTGETLHRILGPVLNGNGYADIPDTDNGSWDGDPVYDRAVGPMQFIPSTWRKWQADGNGDGVKDPSNIFDAALAAGDYLCADGRDLATSGDMRLAILGYNDSTKYLNTVESWYEYFRKGHITQLPAGPLGTGILAPTPGGAGHTGAPSPSASPTGVPSPSASPSHSPQPTVSVSGSLGPVSPSGSPTGSASGSPTGSPSGSPSGSPTGCPTDPASPSPSGSPSDSTTPVPPSVSPTGSASPTPGDPCASESPSPTPTDSLTPSPSVTG